MLVDAKKAARTFYERFGFVVLEVLEGGSRVVPAPRTMFLPLGAVPAPRR